MTMDRLSQSLADRYRIERELGAGGMATVYLAEDLKHHRKVAIKVLREDLAASMGSSRFLREIEIAAQLQHPHILPLLDSGAADGFLYYVMPYVSGQSLRERLAREGELPISEAVHLIIEVVDALVEAHQHGVVHRDIKPDNVMLTGRHALVADFGVAKAISEATGRSFVTTRGVTVGTPTYMSPEQAAADPHIDHRSDIYAVGALAYELLTGRPPFIGTTPQQVLAAHVSQRPEPVTRLRPGVSPELEAVVMKCLEKRPADRWQTAEELLTQLQQLAIPTTGVTPTETRPVVAVAVGKRRWPQLVGGVVAITVVAFLLTRDRSPAIALGAPVPITSDPGLEIWPAVSPDGKFVAYSAGNSARMRIFVRQVGGGGRPLTDDTTAIQVEPRWSPDGTQILFRQGGAVRVAPVIGGTARVLVPGAAGDAIIGADWSPDGRQLLFVRRDSIFVRRVDQDDSRLLGHGTGDELHSCRWAPRGGLIACVSGNHRFVAVGQDFANMAPSRIVVIPAGGGSLVSLTDSNSSANQSPAWSADGRTLFFVSNRDGGSRDIYAMQLSSNGKLRGAAVGVTPGLGVHTISSNGKYLAYAKYSEEANVWETPIPSGVATGPSTARQVTFGHQIIESVRISRDRQWLYYDSDQSGNFDIWRIPTAGGTPERLTTDPGTKFAPDASPDGKEITFHSWANGSRDIFVMSLASGIRQQLTSSAGDERNPIWSPDGRAIGFGRVNVSPSITYVIRRNQAGTWERRPRIVGSIIPSSWSPGSDSLVGWTSSGAILVIPADSGAPRQVYRAEPGTADPLPSQPAWLPGGTIYFKSHDRDGATFWSIPTAGGRPRLLVHLDLIHPSYRDEFSTDGKRLFFPVQDRQSDISLVEIKRR